MEMEAISIKEIDIKEIRKSDLGLKKGTKIEFEYCNDDQRFSCKKTKKERGIIVDITPFNLIVDLGNYKICIGKTQVLCGMYKIRKVK